MFYIKVSTILLLLALIMLAVFACCMMSAWWSRKEEQEDPCYGCKPGHLGVCAECPKRDTK